MSEPPPSNLVDPVRDLTAELYLCDVFAERPLSGNSLAVIVSNEELTCALRQALTAELRHFESVFLTPLEGRAFSVHMHDLWRELPFAGHPLLGAAAVLHARCAEVDSCRWELRVGERIIEVLSSPAANARFVTRMDQGPPSFLATLSDADRSAAAEAFGLPHSALASDLPAEVVSTGLRYLIVPLVGGAIESAVVAHPLIQELVERIGASFAYLLDVDNREGRTWENDGSLEDIATGSAAGPAGAYLVHHGRARSGAQIVITQGRFMGRPSSLNVTVHGPASRPTGVEVSGPVVLVAHGVLTPEVLDPTIRQRSHARRGRGWNIAISPGAQW